MNCPLCGSEVLVDEQVCPHCGRDIGRIIDKWENDGPPATDKALTKPMFSVPLPRGPSRPPPLLWGVHEEPDQKTTLSLLAVALVLLGAVAAVAEALRLFFVGSPSTAVLSLGLSPVAMGAVMLLFGCVAFIGSAYGLMRVQWNWVFLGGVCATMALGWYYTSFVMGLVSVVLLVVTREEFD